MAAAALLRSMARKLARAPTPTPATAHPRPLLAGAGGLHGGARSCHGSSLPPLTSNQIRQGSGDKMAVGMGMAAAAGLRSGSALPSLATRITRAPPQTHHRHLLNRGVHSGSTAPPTSDDKDKIIEDLRRRLSNSRAATGFSGLVLCGVSICIYFVVLPRVKEMRDQTLVFEKLGHELRYIIRADDEPPSVALAKIVKAAGRLKQQRNGTTEKGTWVDKIEEEAMQVFDILKEAAACIDEIRPDLKESRAGTAGMSKSSSSEHKERV